LNFFGPIQTRTTPQQVLLNRNEFGLIFRHTPVVPIQVLIRDVMGFQYIECRVRGKLSGNQASSEGRWSVAAGVLALPSIACGIDPKADLLAHVTACTGRVSGTPPPGESFGR
jgi:hypothetical protein